MFQNTRSIIPVKFTMTIKEPMNRHRQQKIIDLQQRLAKSGVVFGVPEKTTETRAKQPIANSFSQGFPTDLLQRPVLNEITPATYGDISPYGFTLVALRNISMHSSMHSNERFLWCMTAPQPLENGLLFAPGLKNIGINPSKLIQIETRRTIDLLWAMEEAARSGAVRAVVGIADSITFTQSRRLSLAAVRGQTPVFLLRPHNNTGASTAFSRWRLSSRPSQINIFNAKAPGRAAYQVELYSCRDGRKGKWTCHYETSKHNQTHRLSVVAASGHGAPEARQKQA